MKHPRYLHSAFSLCCFSGVVTGELGGAGAGRPPKNFLGHKKVHPLLHLIK